jgi:hypothetical protein
LDHLKKSNGYHYRGVNISGQPKIESSPLSDNVTLTVM